MTKLFKTASMALAATGLAVAIPASAAPAMHTAPAAHAAVTGDMTFDQYRGRDYRDRKHRGRYDQRQYRSSRDRYYGQPVRSNTRVWRGQDNRYYCRRDDGTTGLLVGAGVGALLGHEVAGNGDRTLGALLGGAAGALLGRTIDRSDARCN